MQEIKEQRLTGERALFRSKDLSIEYSIFADGSIHYGTVVILPFRTVILRRWQEQGSGIRTILPWQTHCMRLRRAFDA